MVFSHVKLLDWFVEPDSQTGEDHLSLQTGTETFVKRGDSFLGSHGLDAMEHTIVLGLFSLDLESDFSSIEGDGKDLK
jgi:hypothetical protein